MMGFEAILYFAGIFLGLGILWWASDKVVDHSLTLAQKLGVSSFIIGAILVAVLGALPELIVGLTAVLRGVPEVAVGDIIGANMCNISFVLLVPLFLVKKLTLGKGGRAGLLFMLSVSVVVMLTALGYGVIPRLAGVALLAAYATALAALWYRKEIDVEEYKEELQDGDGVKQKVALIGFFTLAAAGAGVVTVFCAEHVSYLLNISVGTIGALLFALGTSVPEMAIGVNGARRGATGFVLGSVMGAILSHTLFVLGILAVISPAGIIMSSFTHAIPFIAVMYGFLGFKIYTKASICKLDAIILSTIFLIFYLVELKIL